MALIIFGLFMPRTLIIFLYVFSEWFTGVLNEWYWLLFGFLFFPCTMLWYSAVMNWHGGVWDATRTSVLAAAFIIDVVLIARSSNTS